MANQRSVWSVEPSQRFLAGLALGRRSGRLKTVLLRCRGEGWGLRVQSADGLSQPLAKDAELAPRLADSLVRLARRAELPLEAVECVGLDGITPFSAVAAELAERTGLTTVGDFAARDRAAGGVGTPLDPVPDWFLYRQTKRARLLIHLGTTTRVTLLPPNGSTSQLACFDAAPGGDFLDRLTQQLSKGRYQFDPSGHFAVQGRQCADLVAHWLDDDFYTHGGNRFLPESGPSAESIESALEFASKRQITANDVLCSANHFIVQALVDAVRRLLPAGKPFDEILVSGGGTRNGLLWRLISERFHDVPLLRTDSLGFPLEVRTAVHAALLAYCTLENLPAHLPILTGAQRIRILGTITPGSPENWERWINNVADRLEVAREAA